VKIAKSSGSPQEVPRKSPGSPFSVITGHVVWKCNLQWLPVLKFVFHFFLPFLAKTFAISLLVRDNIAALSPAHYLREMASKDCVLCLRIDFKFKRYFCRNWPLFVFLHRNHTRAKTQRAQKLFWDPTGTMVSSGNGPLPRCVIGVWPKLGHPRPLHIGGHHWCARSRYRPPPSLSFCRLSTMGFCVTDFFGHNNCYCHQ
jgi:hypothetical protein